MCDNFNPTLNKLWHSFFTLMSTQENLVIGAGIIPGAISPCQSVSQIILLPKNPEDVAKSNLKDKKYSKRPKEYLVILYQSGEPNPGRAC